MRANVDENIKKARHSAYSLFGSGFHGYNGLDIDTWKIENLWIIEPI
jgi:hypothetical protein